MSNSDRAAGEAPGGPSSTSSEPASRGFILLVALLFAEALLMLTVLGWLLVELVTERPVSYPAALGLIVVVGIAAVWVTAIAVNAIKRKGWVRAAAFTWQILQFAVAVGSFQGAGARPDIGWALLVPAVAVIVLLLIPSVYPRRT
ncbi:hypothetical protein [Homoserinimonas sp. OAct 916]|uniref:hypothetical protein n=1 Tax=Homoserinimonas sp. OAct 916 TaxID=2211450 RepID=UPI0018E4EBCA|nr:hypothetical protein [Homoserinimonas sp. OAct 916]